MAVKNITKGIIRDYLIRDRHLKATQKKLSLPIINRLYRKMLIGVSFPPIQVSSNNWIIDGHHRYIAAMLADYKLKWIPSNTTSATTVILWSSVKFVDEEWDTLAKIRMLDERDAIENNIDINAFRKLLK